MKKALILFVLTAATLHAQTNKAPATAAIDGYAAQVDNTIITYGDVREKIKPFIEQVTQKLRGDALVQQIKKAYIDGRETLIEEALLKSEAKTLGLNLPDQTIDNEVNRIIRERFNNDRTLLSRALIDRRITFKEWREEIAEQITMRAYYNQEVLRRASVSAEDVRKEYDRTREDYTIPFRVKYRFILLNKGSTEEEKAVKRKQAENILAKLRAGADFTALAKDVSEGDSSESPWRDPADVKEELRPALHETPAGKISGLIEAENVFYIVKVEARQEHSYTAFEEVQQAIKDRLLEQERTRLHDRLMDRLTEKHYIKRY